MNGNQFLLNKPNIFLWVIYEFNHETHIINCQSMSDECIDFKMMCVGMCLFIYLFEFVYTVHEK